MSQHEPNIRSPPAPGKAFVHRLRHLSATPTPGGPRRISVTCWSAWAPRTEARLAPETIGYIQTGPAHRDREGRWLRGQLKWGGPAFGTLSFWHSLLARHLLFTFLGLLLNNFSLGLGPCFTRKATGAVGSATN